MGWLLLLPLWHARAHDGHRNAVDLVVVVSVLPVGGAKTAPTALELQFPVSADDLSCRPLAHVDQAAEDPAAFCLRRHEIGDDGGGDLITARPLLHRPGHPVDMTALIKRTHVVQGLISEYRRAA
jgi:hypothetical protein